MRLLRPLPVVLFIFVLGISPLPAQELRTVHQRIADGTLEGVVSGDGLVRTFKGIPYAAPPVGALRWKAPQPVQPWSGVRRAVDFGPRAMQTRVFTDMVFHDSGPSEDCLYLNLWIPETVPHTNLPVMVWIYGGGFVAGASSEGRQDGGNLCKHGVIVVSMNYRLGVFGFLAHPELTEESPHHASGNYGLLDQVAALEWVHTNIAAFGGDPNNVTIFGESAGSYSVSALVASPLAAGLFQKAIGESGALFSFNSRTKSLADSEKTGQEFARSLVGTNSIDALRALPADQVLQAAAKQPSRSFGANIDGWFLPADCRAIYAAGRQNRVPLIAGWNRDEGNYRSFFGDRTATRSNYVAAADTRFGTNALAFLEVYAASTDAEAKRAAQDFSGDQFIGYGTWKWLELQMKSGVPVYRYQFDQALPLPSDAPAGAEPSAPHAGEIEYVFQMLGTKNLPWRAEDRAVSDLMAAYWSNFAKTGDPNGAGLPKWPRYDSQDGYPVLHLAAKPEAAPDKHRARYEFLDRLAGAQ
ncbi:MAG: carboxylesterase family protein [Verrucomicrobiota bacterium]